MILRNSILTELDFYICLLANNKKILFYFGFNSSQDQADSTLPSLALMMK